MSSGIIHTKVKPFIKVDIVTVVETQEVRFNADLHKRMLCDIPKETLIDVQGKLEEFFIIVQGELDKRSTGVKL